MRARIWKLRLERLKRCQRILVAGGILGIVVFAVPHDYGQRFVG
ncbi:MAG: hypothetical protein V3V34_11690 [Kiloniellales bacterium]